MARKKTLDDVRADREKTEQKIKSEEQRLKILRAQEKELTLTEKQTTVKGSFDAFTIEELTDDGIVVTVSLYHGETLLRSAEETITLAEPPVAGATELTDFSLMLGQISASSRLVNLPILPSAEAFTIS